MVLGLKIGGGNGADIVAHVRFDARAGRLFCADRVLGADGRWTTELVDITQPAPMFIMDLDGIEVGWLAYGATGPDFRLVRHGEALPPQPSKDHKQGFRVRLYAQKLLGGVREFASTAKVVISAMNVLHSAFEAAPERGQDLVPVVTMSGTEPVTTKGPQGSSTNYRPRFQIVKWVERPAELQPGAAQSAAAAATSASAQHVPPPAPKLAPAPAPAHDAEF